MAQWSEWMTTGLQGQEKGRPSVKLRVSRLLPGVAINAHVGGRNSHAVGGGDGADVVRGGNGTGDRALLLVVLEALATEEGGTSLRDLEDDGRLDVAGSLERGDDGRRRRDVLRSPGRRSGLRAHRPVMSGMTYEGLESMAREGAHRSVLVQDPQADGSMSSREWQTARTRLVRVSTWLSRCSSLPWVGGPADGGSKDGCTGSGLPRPQTGSGAVDLRASHERSP